MTLKALLLRCDGVLADTDELARTALNQMLADAGFAWRCDRATFAISQRSGAPPERMISFFIPMLGYQHASDDVHHMAAAMVRRQASIFSELLQTTPVKPRPGIIDLMMAAKAEGLRLALVSALPLGDVHNIVSGALGPDGLKRFEAVAAAQGAHSEPAMTAPLFEQVLQKLGTTPADCLVVDCSAMGVAQAKVAGLQSIVIRTASAGDGVIPDAVLVADDIPALIGVVGDVRLDPLNAEQRTALANVLYQVHGGAPMENNVQVKKKMTVANILRLKGSAVKTIPAAASVRELSERLSSAAIGAMVVLSAEGKLAGIVSERDIARGLADHGAGLPSLTVARLMTKAVVTCQPDDSIASISKIMSQRRIRHLPVLENGELVGLVSIGDVLKHRLDEIQLEAKVLRDYALAKI